MGKSRIRGTALEAVPWRASLRRSGNTSLGPREGGQELGTQVEKVEETEEGLMYFLRATPGNELSTLELANFYHEHSLTPRAYPQFKAYDVS